MTWPPGDPVETLIALGGVTLALGTIYRYAIHPLIVVIRGTSQFLRDWNGEPARPGHPRILGVVEQIEQVRDEVTYNGGSSLKDAVRRVETGQMANADLLTLHMARLTALEERRRTADPELDG